MTSRRLAKASRAIREVVSTAILFGLRDPRIKGVTVLDVEVAADMRTAKVYVSVMGDHADAGLVMQGLNSSKGYVQAKIADRIETRYTPVLTFVLDDRVKKSIQTSKMLREIQEDPSDESSEQSPADSSPPDEET